MSKQLKCTDCDAIKDVHQIVIRVINGEVRYENDICPECGGKCKTADPKSGVPRMSFFDNGSGKKKVI